MSTRKVVQITDTHLFADKEGEQKGVNTYLTLEAVVADVAASHGDMDALLLTGDLSQDETGASYERLIEILEPLRGAPAWAVPGNHDHPQHLRRTLSSAGIGVDEDARLGPWRFAMLDSQVPGRVHGELGSGQIEKLSTSLNGQDHVIVVLHHPPVRIDSAWLDASRCMDGDALLAVLEDPPVKAVVCGHVHQHHESRAGGIEVLATPSTCVQFKPGIDEFAIDTGALPGYRVFSLEDDGAWSSAVQRVPMPPGAVRAEPGG